MVAGSNPAGGSTPLNPIVIIKYHEPILPTFSGCPGVSVEGFASREFLVTVKPGTTLRDAARALYENGVGSLLVVGDDGTLVGIFTERDLVKAVAQGASLDSSIDSYMTPKPVTVNPKDSIWKALDMMIEYGIRHIPVVDDEGRLVGVVSMRDLLRGIRG